MNEQKIWCNSSINGTVVQIVPYLLLIHICPVLRSRVEMEELISPSFRAIDAEVTAEGIVLIHADEAEAQRAYCEGLCVNRIIFNVCLDGSNGRRVVV